MSGDFIERIAAYRNAWQRFQCFANSVEVDAGGPPSLRVAFDEGWRAALEQAGSVDETPARVPDERKD